MEMSGAQKNILARTLMQSKIFLFFYFINNNAPWLYIENFSICRTHLEKVDSEKLPAFPRDLKTHQSRSDLNLQYRLHGNPNRKSQVDAVSNKIEAKSSNKDMGTKVKRDIVRFSVQMFT